MRQVPCYLIIGDGRLARHFQYYFKLLQLNFFTWNRKEPIASLTHCIKKSTHVLLLITDSAIEPFFKQYLQSSHVIALHCSGSLVSQEIIGAHPLMTFHSELYAREDYESISFVIDEHAPTDDILLPGIPNQKLRLHPSLKSKYHALCVLSGNFTCLLWQKFFDTLEKEFGLPGSLAHAYLRRQTNNLILDAKNALTGPLVRRDQLTIEKNISALEGDPFQDIYKSFAACYQKLNGE